MTQEILDKIRQEAEGYHSRKLIGYPENEVGAYISGAKRGYELAMEEVKSLKDKIEQLEDQKYSDDELFIKTDEELEQLKNQLRGLQNQEKISLKTESPTPEPGKEYRQHSIDFAKWLMVNATPSDVSIEQFYEQYINQK